MTGCLTGGSPFRAFEPMAMFNTLIAHLRSEATRWAQYKLALGERLGVSPDLLHLQAGMVVLCLVALVLRRSPLSGRPWLVLLALECGNELADLMLDGLGSTEATLGAGLHDLVNTMFAPTLLLLVGRWQRRKSG